MKRTIALCSMVSLLAACGERPQVGYPAVNDVQAMVEAKPVPTDAIADRGPAGAKASADYNAAVEAWGDRISSAAGIVCRNLVAQGMAGVECPAR